MFTRGAFLQLVAGAGTIPLDSLHWPSPTPSTETPFPPSVVQNDLDAIWAALIDVGAQPFRTANQTDVEALYHKTHAAITKPMNTREAWLAIAPVLGALNDGHVGLLFPTDLNNAARRFPLQFALSESNDVLVIADRTHSIDIGSRMNSVNGIPATAFRDTTLAAFGGQTETLHRTRVSMAGAWTAVALFGDDAIYRVRWTSQSGATHETDVLTTPPARTFTQSAAQPYTYRRLRDGTIGFIDYRSCEDLPRFKQFLVDTFTTIKENPIRALIIDIRRNGGGDSALNDELWQYVSTKPFKQFGGTIEKSCARLKGEYGPAKYKEIYGDEAWNAPDGKMFEYGTNPNGDLIHPRTLELRYTGPVYLLISAQTFSSAMSCALAAKDYNLATIVGEETGEPVNSTGETYPFVTPGTGLRAILTTKVFLAPKPHPNNQGVVPDIAVTTTPSDIAAGRDPVLEKTLALIP